MRHCFHHRNIDQYFNEREFRFDDRLNVINSLSNVDLFTLPYRIKIQLIEFLCENSQILHLLSLRQ
jgi:hypothetical protein